MNRVKIIHKIVYKPRNKILFESEKSKSNILSARDQYLLKNKNTDIYKIYIDGIKKIPQLEMNNPLRKHESIHAFLTRNYYFS